MEKAKRGGKRKNAGRKPKNGVPKVPFPVSRVAVDVAQFVRMHSNMTEYVEKAIRNYQNKGC